MRIGDLYGIEAEATTHIARGDICEGHHEELDFVTSSRDRIRIRGVGYNETRKKYRSE